MPCGKWRSAATAAAVILTRVLEALSDAGEALHTAYPVLVERVAQALAVEEILKQHAPAIASPAAATAPPKPARVRT